jgi:hypothetical protein
MLIVILAIPVCLLGFYLTYLCYQRQHYKHSLVIGGMAIGLLLFVISMVGASYWVWQAMVVDGAL